MLPRLEYIKEARVSLGVTQKKLAKLSGISTSMLNQIESGRCKPSYDTARRIFEVLSLLEDKKALHVRDIYNKKLIYADKHDTLLKAIKCMKEHSFSQIPVFDDSKPVGLISDDGLIKYLLDSSVDPKKLRVEDVMSPAPPIVDISTPAKAIVPLLRFSKCMLVSEKGNLVGILTIADTLKMME
jgi:predicted transcriptional regulator